MMSKRTVASVAGVAMIFGLAACGGAGGSLDGLSASEVMERVQEDMSAVTSLSVSGEATGPDAIRALDLALEDGGNYEGTYSIDGIESDVLGVGHRLFVRGEEPFWTGTGLAASSGMAASFAGQWVGLPGGAQPGSRIAGRCDLESFMGGLARCTGVAR